MAVYITDECLICEACVDACDENAIVAAEESPFGGSLKSYIKPELCKGCYKTETPKCSEACMTMGAIVWEMPYTKE